MIEGLTKTFWSGWPGRPSVTVLDGLTLSIEQGQIYGFLGPNGSGKTTTLKILLGLMHATTGRVEVLGKPAGNVMVRKRIGFLPESPYFYDYLTAEEFLTFYGHLAGLDRVELNKRVTHLLEIVGLVDARTRQLRKFSKGMLQRIGLAQALIHDPELVILDEPMSGLDPVGRKQVRDLILGLRDQGKTVFFSTHIIPDVEMICDRVGVLAKGKLLATGRVEELVTRGHTQSVEIVCQGIKADGIPAITSAATRVLQRGQHSLIMLPGPDRLEETLAVIRAQGGTLISVTPQKGSLEELFLEQADGRPKFEASASAEV
ncbi:MAG: ABC transporter ATP-binding protein [Nitrospirota bacterium]|nr:ABC transporter ATP-binding protein [Nitrospirota bacterium]